MKTLFRIRYNSVFFFAMILFVLQTATAYGAQYQMPGSFSVSITKKDAIPTVVVSDNHIRIDYNMPIDGYALEIFPNGCGKKWSRNDIGKWNKTVKKKGSGLGSNVYETSGIPGGEYPEGFSNAIFFTRNGLKFRASFSSAGSNNKQIYKILRRIKVDKSACPRTNKMTSPQPQLPVSQISSNDKVQQFISFVVPTTFVEEKIVVAVNKDFADKYPHWQKAADEMISHVNEVLAKNTKKRLVIAKYETYDAPRLDNLVYDKPEYRLSNSSDASSTFGGMTVFFWVSDPVTSSNGGGSTWIDGKVYGKTYLYESTSLTALHDAAYYIQKNGSDWWNDNRNSIYHVPLHEIGHALGLTDLYRFAYDDYSGEMPQLPEYDLFSQYPFDPMIHGRTESPGFGDLSAFIINHNLYHALTTNEIENIFAKKIIVRVKDTLGQPVTGAKVKIIGIKQVNRDVVASNPATAGQYYSLWQTLNTDTRGEAAVESNKLNVQENDGSRSLAFMVKVEKISPGGEHFVGGDYVSIIDLQRTKLLKNSDTHYVDVVLRVAP